MRPLRVGVVCDLREEGWHSMDLVADMLLEHLPRASGGLIEATRLCPPMAHRWDRLPVAGGSSRARLADRLTSRLWDYPRWLRPQAEAFDLFHIIDHSYAHLVRALPAARTIVSCYDLDAMSAALPGSGSSAPRRWLAGGILQGLAEARHVACVTHATRDELIATGRVPAARTSVVHVGVHPTCVPAGTPTSPIAAGQPIELLHVGSTIPRKRIDLLLQIVAALRPQFPGLTLRRVGGAFTPDQRALAARLGLEHAIVEMDFLERPALADLYRRAALVILPSEREGFGLPVVEAMACGTPVVASAIPALMEVGGNAAVYCAVGDVDRWVAAVGGLLDEQRRDPARWAQRTQASIAQAANFSWSTFAAEMTALYQRLS